MLEICPSLAADTPSCEIHPLGIGGKADPVRLVFTAPAGPAVNVAMIDLGDRFRLLLNEVDAVEPEQPLPQLPVARAFWTPRPDLKTAAAAWIYAGGPHHTVFSQAVTTEHIEDFAEMAAVECIVDRPANAVDGTSRISFAGIRRLSAPAGHDRDQQLLGWQLYCHPGLRVRQYNCRTSEINRHTACA